jgi:hypothetical protein
MSRSFLLKCRPVLGGCYAVIFWFVVAGASFFFFLFSPVAGSESSTSYVAAVFFVRRASWEQCISLLCPFYLAPQPVKFLGQTHPISYKATMQRAEILPGFPVICVVRRLGLLWANEQLLMPSFLSWASMMCDLCPIPAWVFVSVSLFGLRRRTQQI